MGYQSIDDIKAKMEMMMHSVGRENEYYDDFKWFSKVNYTTTTEYFGELRAFVSSVMKDDAMAYYKKDLQEIYRVAGQVLSAKSSI